MVCDMLALDAPPVSFVRFLQRQSEGNPFFVAEYLRTAVSEALLFRDEKGKMASGRPARRSCHGGGLRGASTARIDPRTGWPSIGRTDRCGPTGRRRGGRRRPRSRVPAGGGGLWRCGWLICSRPARRRWPRQVLEEGSGGALRFMHDKLREVAYETLHDERRQDLHRRAAEGIETLFAERLGEWQAALGHHWEQAGKQGRRVHTTWLAPAWPATDTLSTKRSAFTARTCVWLRRPMLSPSRSGVNWPWECWNRVADSKTRRKNANEHSLSAGS